RISVSEVTIATFVPRRAVRTRSTQSDGWLKVDPPVDARGRFGAGDVAFRMVSQEGGPGPDVETVESRFPLRLTSFGPSRDYRDTTPRALMLRVTADGRNYR